MEFLRSHAETDQSEFVRPCIVLKHSVAYWNGPMGICTTLYRYQTFSIVLKRANGNLYDPVSYLNFQYHTETDQWEFVRPCIILKLSLSYWNGPMEICTTLYHTQTFSIILKRTIRNLYDPVSYQTIQYHTKTFRVLHLRTKRSKYFYVWYSMVLKIQFVRPCMVLNVLARYWKFEYGTESFSMYRVVQ